MPCCEQLRDKESQVLLPLSKDQTKLSLDQAHRNLRSTSKRVPITIFHRWTRCTVPQTSQIGPISCEVCAQLLPKVSDGEITAAGCLLRMSNGRRQHLQQKSRQPLRSLV